MRGKSKPVDLKLVHGWQKSTQLRHAETISSPPVQQITRRGRYICGHQSNIVQEDVQHKGHQEWQEWQKAALLRHSSDHLKASPDRPSQDALDRTKANGQAHLSSAARSDLPQLPQAVGEGESKNHGHAWLQKFQNLFATPGCIVSPLQQHLGALAQVPNQLGQKRQAAHQHQAHHISLDVRPHSESSKSLPQGDSTPKL